MNVFTTFANMSPRPLLSLDPDAAIVFFAILDPDHRIRSVRQHSPSHDLACRAARNRLTRHSAGLNDFKHRKRDGLLGARVTNILPAHGIPVHCRVREW